MQGVPNWLESHSDGSMRQRPIELRLQLCGRRPKL
jgi:hypothetical protein